MRQPLARGLRTRRLAAMDAFHAHRQRIHMAVLAQHALVVRGQFGLLQDQFFDL
ncbi:hypothetical protein D3C72_2217460 [compost metagenome]